MFWNELLSVWWMAPLAVAIGMIGTLIGAGGGFILMPILLLLYAGDPQKTPQNLTAISLAMVFANAVSGTMSYARMKRIDYRSGIAFAAAGLPGAVIGRYLITMIGPFFNILFGSLMLIGSLFLMYKGLRQQKKTPQRQPASPSSLRYNLTLGMTISFGVGLLASMLGIGGGIIHVPFMIYALNFPVHFATATSHFVLVFVCGTSVAVDLWHGVLQPGLPTAICLSLGVIPGAILGAKLSKKIHGRWIVITLAGALLGVAMRILMRN